MTYGIAVDTTDGLISLTGSGVRTGRLVLVAQVTSWSTGSAALPDYADASKCWLFVRGWLQGFEFWVDVGDGLVRWAPGTNSVEPASFAARVFAFEGY